MQKLGDHHLPAAFGALGNLFLGEVDDFGMLALGAYHLDGFRLVSHGASFSDSKNLYHNRAVWQAFFHLQLRSSMLDIGRQPSIKCTCNH